MKIYPIPISDIVVPTNRCRREFSHDSIAELAGSIGQNGLIAPVVVRRGSQGGFTLVAGERRLRALNYLWTFGEQLRCGNQTFSENTVPCIDLGELDPVDALEVEIEENVRRTDFTWQEKAAATTRLASLRVQQAKRDEKPLPTIPQLAAEVRPDGNRDAAISATRKEIIVAKHLADTDVSSARSLDDAFKVIVRKEQNQRSEDLAHAIGRSFTRADHSLIHGECLEAIQTMLDSRHPGFDVILSDPPYGIDAQGFNDSGGIGGALGGHFYDDSPAEWRRLMDMFCILATKITKPSAHAYLFCDIERFEELKALMIRATWKVFRTPLIWVNPGGSRVPWPTQGPQRKYQCILYAVKGDRLVKRLASDVLTYPQDPNLNHHAQKPVALFSDLLRRSCDPGDSVLDPFCGSGTIFPAAHGLKIKATGVEMDTTAYGIAAKRLEGLK